jgi:phospholipid/cholesterol/gamma-HCH transport system substrate-binding protein
MSITRPGHLLKLLVLVCAGTLLLTGCDFSVYKLPLPGGVDLGDHPYTVHVKFRDVLDLVPQSAVKVDDVTVGKVEDISLDGYVADVTVQLRGNVKLPDNAEAKIQQTSLLGEKFVALSPPPGGQGHGRLGNGDVIGLDHSGRNPEVEEVLGALSLLLNGGGVGQLKTISTELNKALSGREGDVRSVLQQLDTFMGQLDQHKDEIVRAIQSLNRLAVSINKQSGPIKQALDELPGALASINRQRDDLVKMLKALSRLSSVGTRVIQGSKAATIDSLRELAPTLTELARAGDALPKSLQVFLTYPFVDAVVGQNPVQARNLHMGDYTNLSIKLDLSLRGLGVTAGGAVSDLIDTCKKSPLAPVCQQLPLDAVKQICAQTPLSPLCDGLPGSGGSGGSGGPGGSGGGLVGGGGLRGGSGGSGSGSRSGGTGDGGSGGTGSGSGSGSGGTGDGGSGGCLIGLLCRTAPGLPADQRSDPGLRHLPPGSYDPTLGALLVWGMVQR